MGAEEEAVDIDIVVEEPGVLLSMKMSWITCCWELPSWEPREAGGIPPKPMFWEGEGVRGRVVVDIGS